VLDASADDDETSAADCVFSDPLEADEATSEAETLSAEVELIAADEGATDIDAHALDESLPSELTWDETPEAPEDSPTALDDSSGGVLLLEATSVEAVVAESDGSEAPPVEAPTVESVMVSPLEGAALSDALRVSRDRELLEPSLWPIDALPRTLDDAPVDSDTEDPAMNGCVVEPDGGTGEVDPVDCTRAPETPDESEESCEMDGSRSSGTVSSVVIPNEHAVRATRDERSAGRTIRRTACVIPSSTAVRAEA
jgi:hypothetical protein